MWTGGILVATILVLWFVIAHPWVLLWLLFLGVGIVAYYVLYLLVRARMEGYEDAEEDVH